MQVVQRITPCLWFDDQAEEAARFYTGIFRNSKVVSITRYSDEGQEIHGKPAGAVMVVAFELDGQAFTALNGSPYSSSTRPSRSRSIAKRRKQAMAAMMQMKKNRHR